MKETNPKLISRCQMRSLRSETIRISRHLRRIQRNQCQNMGGFTTFLNESSIIYRPNENAP